MVFVSRWVMVAQVVDSNSGPSIGIAACADKRDPIRLEFSDKAAIYRFQPGLAAENKVYIP